MKNPLIESGCQFCDGTSFVEIFHYLSPPKLETNFSRFANEIYDRKILSCVTCQHLYSVHSMDLSTLYSGDYNSSTYKDQAGMRKSFEKIIQLGSEESDNYGRCNNIQSFCKDYFCNKTPEDTTILDVGSGLGVFPWEMKNRGYQVTPLDPDLKSITHINETTGINGICADFFEISLAKKFDLLTFNKVLEHVPDPILMLKKAATFLNQNGLIYLELPDGEIAQRAGSDREEFMIDHLHIFSFASMSLLAMRSGFTILKMQRLQEPSTKYTLRAFLNKL